MSGDAVELADELLERFSIATVDGAQSDRDAVSYLLRRYPLTREAAAGWRAFLAGVANLLNALPIEAAVAAELRQLLSNAEKEAEQATPATPIRDSLMQYIDMRFTLYALKEGKDKEGKSYSYFVDLQGRGKGYNNKPNAAIRTEAELDLGLSAGITLYHFSPKERGFLCIDVDCGHESGADGFENATRWLEARGFARGYNPLEEARVYVDTPSGGRHCYFTGKAKYLAKIPGLDSVDVFGNGTGATLVAAGSVRKGKAYVLHGRLSDATPINAAFAGYFTNDEYTEQARQAEAAREKANAKPARSTRWKSRAEHTLEEKVAYYAANCPKAGRNNAANHCARRLGWQAKEGRFSEAELYAAIKAHPDLGKLPESELRTAFQSGFEDSKKQP